MAPNTSDPGGRGESEPSQSRRELLGLFAAASAVGIGSVYGLSSMTRRAAAAANVTFEDGTVVLGPDEQVTSATVSGTVEVSYDAGGDEADDAGMTVTLVSSDGDVPTPESQHFGYDDVDPDTDEISQDVTFELDLPADLADPPPGETNEAELTVEVFFGVDRAEPEDGDHVIIETRANDSATLRIEREGGNEEPPEDPTVDVTGTFTFAVETGSEGGVQSNSGSGSDQSNEGRGSGPLEVGRGEGGGGGRRGRGT